MTTQHQAPRFLTGAAAALCATAALGGFVIGFGADDGQALALACLLAGGSLSLCLWMRFSRVYSRIAFNRFMVPMFCVLAGMALYSNVSYLLWGLGYPMAIRAIETGAMNGNSWLPPLNLLWAVLCWWGIDKHRTKA